MVYMWRAEDRPPCGIEGLRLQSYKMSCTPNPLSVANVPLGAAERLEASVPVHSLKIPASTDREKVKIPHHRI